jgi:hypothetical protein
MITDLESIITSKSISTSFLQNLRNELTIEEVFVQISDLLYNPSNYIIYTFLLTYLYGQYKFLKGSQSSSKLYKFKKIGRFNKIDKIIKEIIFILFLVFTKDIQSAS